MKVIHPSFADPRGGAGRAAHRIHGALVKAGVDSIMVVNEKITDDNRGVAEPASLCQLRTILRRAFAGAVLKLAGLSSAVGMHSLGLLPSRWVSFASNSGADVIHRHWVSAEYISIKDVSLPEEPLEWTFHDLWPILDTEHYALTGDSGFGRRARWLQGWVSRRKDRFWECPFHILANSTWTESQVRDCGRFKGHPLSTVHYPIDLTVYRPIDQALSRQLLSLPETGKLIMFCAIGGHANPRKGADLLYDALARVQSRVKEQLHVFVVGRSGEPEIISGVRVSFLGRISDDIGLALTYSAADVFDAPSRAEAFGQTALEAHACGTPVVAFAGTGFADTVRYKETGYLAQAGDANDLADGVLWVLDSESAKLSSAARQVAERGFGESKIVDELVRVYNSALEQQHCPPT